MEIIVEQKKNGIPTIIYTLLSYQEKMLCWL